MAEIKIKILETATRLYMKKGFHQTSLNDIAQTAKINKSSIFYHFDSKVDLFEQALEYRAEIQLKRLERIVINETLSLKEKWELFLDTMYELLSKGQVGCFFGKIGLELNGILHKGKKELKAYFDMWHQLIKRIFQTNYDLQKANELAKHVIIRIEGASVLSIIYSDFSILKKEVELLKNSIT